jgi:hypothetical protein
LAKVRSTPWPVNTVTTAKGEVTMFEKYSTEKSVQSKPAKPYPDFPLTAHPAGYWCKQILGKIHYFGPWDDPDGAFAKYLEQQDALHAGRTPRPETGALTIQGTGQCLPESQEVLAGFRGFIPQDLGRLQERYRSGCEGFRPGAWSMTLALTTSANFAANWQRNGDLFEC